MILTLLDIPVMMDSLKGVCMELQDCALTLLKGDCLMHSFMHIHLCYCLWPVCLVFMASHRVRSTVYELILKHLL